MYSRYLITLLAVIVMQCVNAQQKKAVNEKVNTTLSKKKITEQQAKRINEAQLAKAGKAGTRRAYKRSDIEKILHTEQDGWTAAMESERIQLPAVHVPEVENRQILIKKEPVVTAKSIGREPKFIEGIVLERNR
jgi:hypothetical protein